MKLKISDLYYDIFGNKSSFQGKKNVSPEKFEEDRRIFENAIYTKYQEILESKANSQKFRDFLRSINARSLERILYPASSNNPAQSTMGQKQDTHGDFPTDDEIKKEFSDYDKQYHLTTKYRARKMLEEKFVIYFKGAKLIADYIENNNSLDNRVAYQHALKLLVLFGQNSLKQNEFSGIERFINSHAGNISKPVYKSLINAIPDNLETVQLKAWEQLFHSVGFDALKFFQRAPEIQKQLGNRAPNNYAEVIKASSEITYKRASEDPDLANLCMTYSLRERDFEKCLALKSQRKTADNLPNLMIDGSALGHPDTYLVKLPIDDDHAFVLGHMTNCCQSIGGDSEACVIDGVTRHNNGFYVLLSKKKEKIPPKNATPEQRSAIEAENKEHAAAVPMIDGKINHRYFKIAGQGYAWLSKAGNLTFDSWENADTDADDVVIAPLLTEFAKVVTQSDNDIARVTIGKGGKTPEILKNNSVSEPEIQLEGVQYYDSEQQALLYINRDKINKEVEQLSPVLNQLPDGHILKENQTWVVDEFYSVIQIRLLKKLLTHYPSGEWLNWLFANPNARVNPVSMSTLQFFDLLHTNNILTREVVKNCACDETNIKFTTYFIHLLNAEKKLSTENLVKLHADFMQTYQNMRLNSYQYRIFVRVFDRLAKLGLLTETSLQLLINQTTERFNFLDIEKMLNEIERQGKLTPEYQDEINLCIALYPFNYKFLKSEQPNSIINVREKVGDEIYSMILQDVMHASSLVHGSFKLAEHGILNVEVFAHVRKSPDQADKVVKGYMMLKQNDLLAYLTPLLLQPKNLQLNTLMLMLIRKLVLNMDSLLDALLNKNNWPYYSPANDLAEIVAKFTQPHPLLTNEIMSEIIKSNNTETLLNIIELFLSKNMLSDPILKYLLNPANENKIEVINNILRKDTETPLTETILFLIDTNFKFDDNARQVSLILSRNGYALPFMSILKLGPQLPILERCLKFLGQYQFAKEYNSIVMNNLDKLNQLDAMINKTTTTFFTYASKKVIIDYLDNLRKEPAIKPSGPDI